MRSLHEHGARPSRRLDKVCLGTHVLDRLLDRLLNLVPVAGVDALDVASEMLLNLVKHFPFPAAGDEGDGDTNASKPAGTTDAVEISLKVGFSLTGLWVDQLRNVLKQSITKSAWSTS